MQKYCTKHLLDAKLKHSDAVLFVSMFNLFDVKYFLAKGCILRVESFDNVKKKGQLKI